MNTVHTAVVAVKQTNNGVKIKQVTFKDGQALPTVVQLSSSPLHRSAVACMRNMHVCVRPMPHVVCV